MERNYFGVLGGMAVAALVTIAAMAAMFGTNSHSKPCDPIVQWYSPQQDVVEMPIVLDTDPITASHKTYDPQEQRGPQFARWLAPSFKIRVSGASGSGTLVYFDQQSGYGYVASCGHLWNGNRSAQELQRNPVSCKVITWYHNETKLDSPKEYPAEVLFWSNTRGWDSSLIRFKPDWTPKKWFPIAALDHNIPVGSRLHSCGCDGGREVAHYDVEVVGMRSNDLITRYNSPRPGRSGGGLMDDGGWYVGTCWGTSDTQGNGIGYFTPLSSIHEVYTRNGYDWILNVRKSNIAQSIPIFDWNNPQQQWPAEHIPIPSDIMPLPTMNVLETIPTPVHWIDPESYRLLNR